MVLVLVALCEVLWLLAVVLLACLLEPLSDCNISFGKKGAGCSSTIHVYIYIYIVSFLFFSYRLFGQVSRK